jgi:hypothetical protein
MICDSNSCTSGTDFSICDIILGTENKLNGVSKWHKNATPLTLSILTQAVHYDKFIVVNLTLLFDTR